MHTILQVLPRMVSGGVERGATEISHAIESQGMNSIIASKGGNLVSAIYGKHIELPLESKNPYRIISNIFALSKIIKDNKVSIIHARSRAPAWSSYFAAKLNNIPFVTTFHGTYNFNNPLKKLYNSIMTKGDRVIAVSDFIKEHIIKNYNINPSKIRTINRGADTNYFCIDNLSQEKMEILQKKYKIPHNATVILMPGRLTRWKGQDLLIDALKLLERENFFCIIVGENTLHANYTNSLKQKIKKYNLENKVIIGGIEYDILNLYGISDIVIVPSIEPEAFGRVSIEAQSMERLVIASDVGGTAETIIDNKTGLLFQIGNSKDLAEKIAQGFSILNDKSLTAFQEEARKNVMENFSLKSMKEKTINVYKELL